MKKDKKNRIFIAGDDPLLRAGLKVELEQVGHFNVVGEAGNGRAAVSGVRSSLPDLSIIDASLPGLSAVNNIKCLRKAAPVMKIVMLTTFGDDEVEKRVMAAGADGYIMKSTENHMIVEMINDFLCE